MASGQWYVLAGGQWRGYGRADIGVPPLDDYGAVGSRPVVAAPPSGPTTGPQASSLQTMTGPQALAAVLAATPDATGFRTLSRVEVTSTIIFNNNTHSGLRFDNCLFRLDTPASYSVSSHFSTGTTPAVWNEFRNCEFAGIATSALIVGGYLRLLRCNLHHGNDLIKPFSGMEVWASWLHDIYMPVGGHCDCVQIVSGAANSTLHYNTFDAFIAPESPSGGGWPNAVLQTGSVTADIGPVMWRGNWMDGGAYTIQPIGGSYNVGYTFRDNRFGRGYQYGAVASITASGVDFDSSNVWNDTGLPVLE